MPVTNLVAYVWIRSKWLISATRFGELAGIPYLRCGRTKAPCKWKKADFERSWAKLIGLSTERNSFIKSFNERVI